VLHFGQHILGSRHLAVTHVLERCPQALHPLAPVAELNEFLTRGGVLHFMDWQLMLNFFGRR
jgi:hypothetical protein